MKLKYLPLLFLPLTALADGERLPYGCDNGSRIDLSFSTGSDGRPQATLHFADGDLTLPQVPAASGALYRADDIRVHTRDNEAVFEDGKGNVRRCTQGAVPLAQPTNTAPAVSSFLDITGSVSYRLRIVLPPDAILVVRVQDTRPGARARTLAEQRIELGGRQVPIAFSTTIDRDLIGKSARVTVSARVESRGKLLLASDKAYPALRNGEPNPVDIQLKQVARAKAG
ncbi:YbaY family lipoprotein [Dechloromonas sp. A34]|uniref:YbaY family lipoprotein n=1 Tax=Dechloromonas sp. A34 TaxID=447588 RepID=UPI00224921A2|nr:YbaY family lipoprotein [Dechloromonas sp. A34]